MGISSMNPIELKQRIASLLLEELKKDDRAWYYISIANDEFLGGVFIRATGSTDAWVLLHGLNLFPMGVGAATQTTGPLEESYMAKVPDDMRWCLLTLEQIGGIK